VCFPINLNILIIKYSRIFLILKTTKKQKNMRKSKILKSIIIIVSVMMINVYVVAQNVGIGPNVFTPDNSAGVEMQFTNKGLLIPRVALASTTDGTTIPSPAHSLLVYNNGGTGALNPEGFYYNAGTPGSPNWVKLSIAKVDGLGTPTQVAFWVDTDSISSSNKLNWNTVDNRLEVTGKVKIVDGSQGVDKILTSDNSGIGTWKSLGTGPTGCASCISKVSDVSTPMSWGACAQTCRDMTTGGTDWRMPTFDEVIYYVSGASNISFTASSNYIWTSTPFDARINPTTTSYNGHWVLFDESSGYWANSYYSDSRYCRCVR